MEYSFQTEVLQKLKQKRRKRFWKRVLSAMMCLVVFCTTYALILPAITKETDTFCGFEAHTHTAKCFARPEDLICGLTEDSPHVHTDACAPIIETAPLCGLEESEGHTHTEACKPRQERLLICDIPQVEGHTHDAQCVTLERVLSCKLKEAEGHTHDDTCYMAFLTCTLPEDETHTHQEACYIQTLACDLETQGHAHSDSCYTLVESQLCDLEEAEGHTHSDGCFTTVTVYGCGAVEAPGHAHSEACFTLSRCDLETAPHTHTDACYASPLICPLEESEAHTHTISCYNSEPLCGMEIHTHSLQCYSDPEADRERPSFWEATLPETLTGNYPQDLLAVALTQLGYTESTKNYTADGTALRGYTRYGDWYGSPYGDWCAMFVSFCLHYAQVEGFPLDANCPNWVLILQELGLFQDPSEYVPKPGDIIFFDWEEDGTVNHVGMVETLEDLYITTIEGNSNNQVARCQYELHDGVIAGYGVLPFSAPTVTEDTPEGEDAPVTDTPSGEIYSPEDSGAWADLVNPVAQAAPTIPTKIQGTTGIHTGISKFNLTATSQATPKAGQALDLTPYINSVVMYDANKNPIPNGSIVTEGDLIEFRIEYTVTGQQLGVMNGENITVYSNTLTYDLPDAFRMVNSDSGNIRNSAGQVVGSYDIDKETGKITMTFTDDYVKQNAQGIQIHGYISFFSNVEKVTDEDGEHQDFEFKDGIVLGVVIEEKVEAVGDLEIEKREVSANGEDLVYEIIVTSANGTNGPVTVTDQMSTGLTFKEGISVKRGNGSTVSGVSFQPSADKSSFTMTLPDMEPGDSYIIRYRCAADINLLDAEMTVQNTATVTGKDSQDKELKDRFTVNHTFDILKKTGQKNDDGSITWTITINQSKADISGWILEDKITIANATHNYPAPVTIRDSRGNIVANNVTLPYTFPEGSKDTYTVTYSTLHAYGDGDTIYNKAILRDENTEINSVTGVTVGTPFEKTGEAGQVIQDANGNYLLPITWTVTINTANGPIAGNQYFADKFQGYPSEDVYMTYDQLMAALANLEDAVEEITGEELEGFSARVYTPGPEITGKAYNIFDLWNNVDNCQSEVFDCFYATLGPSGIPQGKVLTFSYESYGVFPNNIVSTSRFVNKFNLIDQYETEGVVDYVVNSIKGTKYAIAYYDPETQADQDWFWGETDWGSMEGSAEYEYNKLKDGYLAWAIEVSVPPNYTGSDNITLYEDLPEGVSVKELRWTFQNSVPIQQLKLTDMKPGNTYTWDFMLYPADQIDNTWNPQGGQMVSITVNCTEAGDVEITVPGIVYEVMGEYAALHGLDESYGCLYIFTQINDDLEWTASEEDSYVYVNTFENRFTIKNEKDVVIDVGSQSQHITKDERDGMIKKTGTTEEDNIITYSVILNSYKKDMIENSGVLAIHDILTYQSTDAQPLRLRLVPGSVKLYEIRVKSDGSYEKLREITANYKYNESSYVQYGITHWSHTIDMTVPDSTSLLLEYSYKATGDKTITHNISNVCEITGVGQGDLEGNTRVELDVMNSTAQADTEGIMIYKVDANSDGIFLEGAKFNIYIWNEDMWNPETGQKGKYILVNHPDTGDTTFTTDANGMIVLDASTVEMTEDNKQFAYNTAYYIQEIESPTGYYLGPDPYYFYIVNDDLVNNPECIPEGFEGHALTSGDIIYRQNVSQFTEITVEKYWKDYGGTAITVTGDQVTSVTLELWQMLRGGNPADAKRYGTYTMTPDEAGNWSLTITDLPKSEQAADGTRGTDYLYFIKEVGVNGFALESSENNQGIPSGTIKLVNRQVEGYELPETGGAGTTLYTMAGLLLILISAAYLMYSNLPRRREEF